MSIQISPSGLNFSAMHDRMQWYVDQNILPSCQTLVLSGTDVIDHKSFGPASYENSVDAVAELNENSIYRIYSNTKLITSIAAMMLFEEEKFALDDPLHTYIKDFANMQVLKPDAQLARDTEAVDSDISIRQIMSHSSGLSYAFVEPESLIDRTYAAAGINPLMTQGKTLEGLCAELCQLPLAFQPGTNWRYSLGTDVLARLIEIWSGQRFDEFLKQRIFSVLDMSDTDFYVPEDKLNRLTAMYAPNDLLDVMASGYALADAGAATQSPGFLSGGGGLLSTLSDYTSFVQMLINQGTWKGQTIIKPETLELMRSNQLAQNVGVNFPMWDMTGTTFGLGFALKEQAAKGEPKSAIGEYHWGGLAGTHSWMNTSAGADGQGISGICMTQVMPAFWHPFSHDFKRMVYEITA